MSNGSSLPIQAPRQQLFTVLKSSGFSKHPCREPDEDLTTLDFDWVWTPPGPYSDLLTLSITLTSIDGEPLYGMLRINGDLAVLDMVQEAIFAHFDVTEDIVTRKWTELNALVYYFSEPEVDRKTSANLTVPIFLGMLQVLLKRVSSVEFWSQVKILEGMICDRRRMAHRIFVSKECTPIKDLSQAFVKS